MKFNKKALRLIEKGLSAKTVSKLDESQINVLHSKLISEQVKPMTPKQSYEIGTSGGILPPTPNGKGYSIKQDPNTKKIVATAAESEMAEQDELDITKDSDATEDGMGIFEEDKDYKGKANPWAICHAQVGPKKTRKFERCVQSVKKQLGEGKNPVSLFLENEIMKIVERNLPPRITKKDLVKYLTEAEPAVAPTKPTVKPGTPPREKPKHPGKNPNPGVKPAPKAKKVNEAEPAVAPTKPTVKPGTPPREKPKHPGKNPNPGVNPKPKAKGPSLEAAKDKVIDIIKQLLEK